MPVRSPYVLYGALLLLLTGLTMGLVGSLQRWPLSWSYLAAINVAAFVLMALDKSRAQVRGLRVPEVLLFLAALLGGSIGTLFAMRLVRHKTASPPFQLVLGVIFLGQLWLVSTYGDSWR